MVNFFFEEMRKYQIISQNKELQRIKKIQINLSGFLNQIYKNKTIINEIIFLI